MLGKYCIHFFSFTFIMLLEVNGFYEKFCLSFACYNHCVICNNPLKSTELITFCNNAARLDWSFWLIEVVCSNFHTIFRKCLQRLKSRPKFSSDQTFQTEITPDQNFQAKLTSDQTFQIEGVLIGPFQDGAPYSSSEHCPELYQIMIRPHFTQK